MCFMWKKKKWKKDVLVSGGVDIKNQMSGSKKGMYFTGDSQEFKTHVVGSDSFGGWEVTLLVLNTGMRYVQRFTGYMMIGRGVGDERGTFLTLSHDNKISKVHCCIYEVEGKLCVQDQQSKNHTYVNEKRIDAPVWLEQGCIIKMGMTGIKVERIMKLGIE